MQTTYDEVAYPSAVYQVTHPSTLGVVPVLSGVTPAPVENCRVLELGCGDGYNLIAMAYGLPGSQFVGVDLAEKPIARGNLLVERLGLQNVKLLAADVAEVEFDEFDYIIAHGLYSWVPDHVREKVMEICGKKLSAHGIAYISYNAYPGNHFRDLVRGMMRFHTSSTSAFSDQVGQARALVKVLANAGNPSDPYRGVLERELERIEKYTDAGFFHDDLSDLNRPFYLHEVAGHAGRHGLQFLGEVEIMEKQMTEFPKDVQALLDQIEPDDLVTREQYIDFVRMRSFRRTLLCHAGIPLISSMDANRMEGLYVCGELQVKESKTTGEVLFVGCKKAEIETARPLAKAALRRLGESWPMFLKVSELIAETRNELGRGPEHVQVDTEELCATLLQAAIAGAVELRTSLPRFTLSVGEYPRASRLARVQLEVGDRASTLLHGIVQIADDLSRLLLSLLDGSRNRSELREALRQGVRDGMVKNVKIEPEQITDTEIQLVLERLARLGVMEA